MTILILGSEGFIGRHLVKYFSENKFTILKCDIQNIVNDHYYKLDDKKVLDIIFKENNINICINAAGSAHVQKSFDDPLFDFQSNTILHFYTLNAIRKFRPKCKYINLSSAAVYGNPIELPISEQHASNPLSPYGFHKKISEIICQEYFDLYHINTLNVRIFSAYGPGQMKLLFWDTYQKVKKNINLEFFGTGNESRDYIHVYDIAYAIDLLIQNHTFDGGCVNIANGKEIYIKDAIDIFLEVLGHNRTVTFSGEDKIGDPKNWLANIHTLKKYGYAPKYSLIEGLKTYKRWLVENDY